MLKRKVTLDINIAFAVQLIKRRLNVTHAITTHSNMTTQNVTSVITKHSHSEHSGSS